MKKAFGSQSCTIKKHAKNIANYHETYSPEWRDLSHMDHSLVEKLAAYAQLGFKLLMDLCLLHYCVCGDR